MDAKQLREQSDTTFTKRLSLTSLWQEQACNFYPERADFTYKRYLGDDFAGDLMSSYPILVRRDMGDQIGTMLRNTSKPWFRMTVEDKRRQTHAAKAYLEWATETQRNAMYDGRTRFTRATKEGDNDYVTFGQTALSVSPNRDRDGMIYRCWHLRDVAWLEDEEGKICTIFRRWRPAVHTLKHLFDRPNQGRKIHPLVQQIFERNMFEELECLHIMTRAEYYDGPEKKKGSDLPWVSIHYDCANNFPMEVVNQRNREYVIPRWQTVSGSQYGYSPATIAALPEARLLQAMTYTLLDAGEKVANPPMVAVDSVIRSDMGLYAGGVTWVDAEYDERLGEALRPITRDARGMPLNLEMQKDSRNILAQCFYLNKLTLPQRAPEMTAYEVAQRIQEYIRGALPLFEPMEADYNGELCEETNACMREMHGFGPDYLIPRELQGAEVRWRFESPLHDAIEEQKEAKFERMSKLLATAVAMDRNAASVPNAVVAFRDTLAGIGIPTVWTRSETESKQMQDQANAEAEAQKLLATMQQGADVANTSAQASNYSAQAQTADAMQ